MFYQRRTRMFSLIMLIFVLFSFSVPAFGQASDISGHWAEKEIIKWSENGIISGFTDGTFRPEASIARADFVALISRIFSYIEKSDKVFPDVSSKAWYAETVSKAVAAGIIFGDDAGNFRPTDPISREEAAIVLCNAFKLSADNKNAADSFADKAKIANWSKSAVSALVEKGYVSGKPGNLFAPKDNITRGEAVKLLDNIANELKNAAGTYTEDIKGNLVVNTADVVLKDMVIEGDLFIAQGVGDGDITLDGVTIKGRTVVLGGGENSIIIKNSSLEGTLLVIKVDGKVRIVASGSTTTGNVQLNSGAILKEEELTGEGFGKVEIIEVPANSIITLDGDFEDLTVSAPEVIVDIRDGSVENLVVEEEGESATILISGTASVTTFTANAAVDVSGTGTIETANIKSDGVTIEQKPTNVNIDENITAIIDGEEVKGEETPEIPPSGGGGFPTTPAVEVSNIKMNLVGSDVSANASNEIDLSGLDDSIRVAGISFTVNAENSTLNLNKIKVGSEEINITLSKVFTSGAASVSIRDLFGALLNEGQENVSMASLRGLPGTEVTVIGTLSATNYTTYPVSIKVILGGGEGNTTIPSEWALITVDGNTITADIRDTKKDIPLNEIEAVEMLSSFLGTPSASVKIGDDTWVTLENNIEAVLTQLGGASWSSRTLGSFVGKTLYFKRSINGSLYTLNFI